VDRPLGPDDRNTGVIPRIICRSVPADTTETVEEAWEHIRDLHPGWELVTYRDPIDPDLFPITSYAWPHCTSGAQLAGLLRLEALHRHGGIYLDSDVELYRPLDPFLVLRAFAAWEDTHTIPDAVLGAEPGHDAIATALELALARLSEGPWASGPGVITEIFSAHPDVMVLPPAVFYPYHYSERERRGENFGTAPWCYGVHHWAASWLGSIA
jgi:mannosyltransferase OCH1-like enzyme